MKNRIEEIRSILKDKECALITSGPSRYYFTGFRSSAGTVVITRNSATFLIDFRYIEKAKKAVNHMNVELAVKLNDQIKKILSDESIETIYVETDTLSVKEFGTFSAEFGIEVSSDDCLTKKITELRSVKSAGEIALIKEAQRFTDETFKYITERICVGKTEREIMLDMEFYMRSLGADAISFDFIVVSGKNSSLPHGVPTDKRIETGDFITMDFGALYHGYCSDMTRTVAVGNISDEQKRVYNTVLEAQLSALNVIKAGMVCKDVDKVARDIIYSNGYEGCFGHGLGHSVGIEIHENPSFNTRCETKLKSGMIMTVEPGIYLENKFGVRIEDMVVVTDDGYENLTASPKELIIL